MLCPNFSIIKTQDSTIKNKPTYFLISGPNSWVGLGPVKNSRLLNKAMGLIGPKLQTWVNLRFTFSLGFTVKHFNVRKSGSEKCRFTSYIEKQKCVRFHSFSTVIGKRL